MLMAQHKGRATGLPCNRSQCLLSKFPSLARFIKLPVPIPPLQSKTSQRSLQEAFEDRNDGLLSLRSLQKGHGAVMEREPGVRRVDVLQVPGVRREMEDICE